MRNVFSKQDLSEMFTEFQNKTGMPWDFLAKEAKISKRNLLDWRKGKISIPTSFLELLKNKFAISVPSPKEIISESEMRSRSGKIGGIKTNRLYGNPGTSEGRYRGGISSYQKQVLNPNSPFLQKPFVKPNHSIDLAEFVGILLGDGGITTRQVTIVVHKTDEKEYSLYISKLIKKVFGLSAIPKERETTHVTGVVVSRTGLVKFFESMDIHKGNKVRNQVKVPKWIRSDIEFKKACIRGLFDTDGCVYIDTHIIREKKYENLGMNFSNRSKPLLSFFKETLVELGFSPTQSTPNAIVLRKEQDVVRYFRDMGSSNSKHIKRFETYLNRKRKGTEVVITAPTRNRMVG